MTDREKIRQTYRNMKDRTTNKRYAHYMRYGGRGIKVCDEWLNDFESFYKWSLENGYKKGLSIDRINNDGNYEPNNCRWATKEEQANNKCNNSIITYNGQSKTIAEWSEITGKSRNAMYNRHVAGCTPEEIILGKKQVEKMQSTIKGLRKSLGLTQREFAKKLGITRECIANYEASRREPNAEFYKKLSVIFGVSDSKIGEIVIEMARENKASRKD